MANKSTTLYVSGLDANLVETALREEFAKHAEIERVTVIRDKKTRVSKGFAYIVCKTEDDSSSALNALNGKFMCGQKITVKYSNSETPDWLTVLQNRGALKEESAPSVPRIRGGMPMRGPGRGFRGAPGRGGPGMRGSRGSPHGAPRGRGAGRPNGHYESPRGRGGVRDGWRGREGPPMRSRGGAPRGRGGAPSRDRGYLGYDDEGYDVEPRGRRGPPEGRSRPAMPRDDLEPPQGRQYGGIDSDQNGLDPYDAPPTRQPPPPRTFQNRYEEYPTDNPYAPREPVRHMPQRRAEPVDADYPPARSAYRERSPMGRDNYHADPYAQAPAEDQYRQAGPRAVRPDPYAASSRMEVDKRPDPYAMKPSYSRDPYADDSYALQPVRESVRGRPSRGRPPAMIPRRGGGGYAGDMY